MLRKGALTVHVSAPSAQEALNHPLQGEGEHKNKYLKEICVFPFVGRTISTGWKPALQ